MHAHPNPIPRTTMHAIRVSTNAQMFSQQHDRALGSKESPTGMRHDKAVCPTAAG